MSTMWEPRQPTIAALLQEIDNGTLALPRFQRPPVWQPRRNEIPFLIAILLGRPTGSLLTLGYLHEPKKFPVHAVDGASETTRETAERLILDGQQRLTTLYRALRCGWRDENEETAADGSVTVRVTVERMIVNVHSAVNRGSLEEDDFTLEAGADADVAAMAKTGRIDFRTLGDRDALKGWLRSYLREWGEDDPEKEDLISRQLGRVIPFFEDVLEYRFPDMELKQDTEVGVVAEIFEHMNSRGQALNRFDLMVARMYVPIPNVHPADYYDLRARWTALLEDSQYLQRVGIDEDDGLMPLQLVAWRHMRKVTTAAVLELPDRSVTGHSEAHPGLSLEAAVSALDTAAGFLVSRCGVAAPRLLPQKAMLVPLANLYLRANLSPAAGTLGADDMKKWFFASCFTQPAPRYYGGVNSRVAEDCAALEAWVDTGVVPDYVEDLTRDSVEALDLAQPMSRERNILGLAALALVVHSGAKDWSHDQPLVRDMETIHLHHMVPDERLKTWWPGAGENRQRRLNIANFTPISAKKNQRHGADSPGLVLDSLEGHARAILASHCVDEDELRSAFETEAKFASFCDGRARRLKQLICDELGL